VPATGSATYSYLCVGCGHNLSNLQDRLYKVRAVDNASNAADSDDTGVRFSRPVATGPNLLAVPLPIANSTVEHVLRTVSFDVARTYRALDGADPWKSYSVGRGGDLDSLQFGEAIWVNATAPGGYTHAGLAVTSPSVRLVTGWNLVSYATWSVETRAASMAGIPDVAVETAGAVPDPYRLRGVSGSALMWPGEAYWIYVASDDVWVQG